MAWVGVACEVRAKNSLITEREIVLFALVNSTGLLKGFALQFTNVLLL